jgi:hypothetical protein
MANTTVTGKIGDQEVELINAASEATLLKLLEAMNKMAGIQTGSKPAGGGGSGTNNAQTQAKAANSASDALTKVGTGVGKFASAIASATTSVLGFAGTLLGGVANAAIGLTKELLFGGDKVSDFTKHLAGMPNILGLLGSAIHFVTGYVENLVTNFQTLSQVGANFGYSLVGMKTAAAQSGMSLDNFTKFVGANSQKLAMLGTSTSAGAVQFGKLSKALRESDVGQQLIGMGFTVDELNDTLLTNSVINARLGRDTSKSTKESIESAGKFALELDKAAAASGISRQKLSSAAEQMSRDTTIRAAARAAFGNDEAKRKEFITGLTGLTETFPDAQQVILDGARGFYNTPEMAQMNAQFPEFIGIMDKFRKGQISGIEAQAQLVEGAKKANLRIESAGGATLRAQAQLNPAVKSAIDSIGNMAAYVAKSAAELEADQKKEKVDKAILNFFAGFSNMIERFRARLAEILLDSPAFKKLTETLNSMFGEGNSTLRPVLDGIATGFTKLLTEVNEFIVTVGSEGWGTAFKNAFTHLLSAIFLSEDEMQAGKDGWMSNEEQMAAVQEKLKGYLIEGFKLLGSAMVDGAKALWEDPAIKNAIILGIGGLFALVIGGKFLGGLAGGLGQRAAGGNNQPGNTTTAGVQSGGFLAGLGQQFTQAAGWLMKGAAIGASMVAIGYGLGKMAEGMAPFADVEWESMAKAGVALGALTGAMMLLGNVLTGPQLVGFAIGTAAIAALGLALRAFPSDVLRELSVMMSTVFEGVSKNITAVFNGIGNIIGKITEMRTAMVKATTDQIKELAGIPADNMFAAAKGIQAIADALDNFTPGLLGGISQGLGNLFSGDKAGPLEKMADIGPRLAIAADGFNAFKAAMSGFSLGNLDISNGQVSNFIKMADKFPDFNAGIEGLSKQASGLNATTTALTAFNEAAKDFDIGKFTFTRDQLSSLADGTVKLRALAEQLNTSREAFKKLDDQGLKNIKEGITSLSTEMKALTLFLQGDFAKALDAIRSKDQVGLLSDLGAKLDTLNSSVVSLVAIEDASKRNLDTIVSKKAGKIT